MDKYLKILNIKKSHFKQQSVRTKIFYHGSARVVLSHYLLLVLSDGMSVTIHIIESAWSV